jgi:membrane associated rhomboid family serine protease
MQIKITPAVKVLLIVCFAMFMVQQTADQFFGGGVLGWLALTPSDFVLRFRFWQLFTYVFLHGDVMHLFLNLLMLTFIGGEIETAWGTRRFVRFFFICTSAAGILYLFMQMAFWKGAGIHQPMVGASGGIYGLLMAYGLVFGERTLLFMMIFPMKAKHFVWILATIEFMTTVFSPRTGGALSAIAHLGGMAAGFGYLWGRAAYAVAKKRRAGGPLARGKPRRKKKSHLKLVIDNEREGESADDDVDQGPRTWH